MKPAQILVVDEAASEPAYARELTSAGLAPLFFSSTAAAFERLSSDAPDAAVVACGERSIDGLDFARRMRAKEARLPVVVVSPNPSVEETTAALRLGAGDYLAKPWPRGALAESLTRLIDERRRGAEYELLRRQVERPYSFDDIIGTSPAMQKVFETIERVATSDVDVLVCGETGTGKELVARAIHRRSHREKRAFVPVDCGAIPENLLEGEFFGHEKGAYTGADRQSIGLLEFADGGTFFLDELGELPLVLQAKLLRTLQERRIRRVGARDEIPIDVRVVAATARDLDRMVAEGTFRRDLFYRINVVRVDLPPLRDRGDDLGLLAEYFAAKYSREMGRHAAGITPEAYQVFQQYNWPGNARELQNVIRRAIALSSDAMIGLDDLPDALVAAAGERAAGSVEGESNGYFALRDRHLARFERDYLSSLLARHKGDVKLAAIEARLPRGTLYRLMKAHALEASSYRDED